MLKRQLRPLSHRLCTRRARVATVVVAVLIGAAMATATATAPVAASKHSQPLLEFARQMGAPGWLLTAGTVLGTLFFLGEPIQENCKT